MSMRIELLERMPGEAGFRAVAAPGLGVWRASEPGVGVYKYVKQVTNLSAPADYRGLVALPLAGPPRPRAQARRTAHPPVRAAGAPLRPAASSLVARMIGR